MALYIVASNLEAMAAPYRGGVRIHIGSMCRSGPYSEQQEGQRLVLMWMFMCIVVHKCMPYFVFLSFEDFCCAYV